MSVFAHLVEQFADLLRPLFHGASAAAAVVLFTALVRLLVHPLSRAAARGARQRAALRPQIAALRRKYPADPERLQRAVLELHTRERVSPLSGCLPGLLQAPAFLLLYHLFSSPVLDGEPNALLRHRLLGAPLGGRWADALDAGGVLGGAGAVYLGLFAVAAAVAVLGFRRARTSLAGGLPADTPGAGAVARVMPFLSFFPLVTVAVVPLAAGLYVVTGAAWSAAERALLYP